MRQKKVKTGIKRNVKRKIKKQNKTKAQRYKCSGCNKEMVRTTREYFCPKCGLTEEIVYDGP